MEDQAAGTKPRVPGGWKTTDEPSHKTPIACCVPNKHHAPNRIQHKRELLLVFFAPLRHLHLVLHLQDVGEEGRRDAFGHGGGALALGLAGLAAGVGHLVVGLVVFVR